MRLDFISLIVLLSPAAFIITSLASRFQSGLRPSLIKKMGIASTLVSILIAATSSLLIISNGLLETPFIGIEGLGFSLRIDAVSILMFSMISILSFIIMRFSLNYLDGDSKQGQFIGRLAATIASVQLLVLAGNLGILLCAWVLTSMSLHRLLVFYKERPGAIIAARKKFIVARLGDACLLGVVALLYLQFGTGNLEVIFQEIKLSISTEASTQLEIVALLLVLAAVLKSAQFPTHGWLVEVMETPTPVSALLHAGLLNAGPFLLIRMAYVMEATTYASAFAISIGAFTALFASIAFLTQTSVKTALGYSSVGHMGFSLMVCGLGVYPAAMLHLVAHSFYKAHSFLSSGSIIDVIRTTKIKSIERVGSPFKIALGIILALSVYVLFATMWGIDPVQELSLLVIGGIMVMGLSRVFTSAIDSNGSMVLILRATFMVVTIAATFFALEAGAHHLLASQLPEMAQPSFVEMVLMAVILLTFGAVVFIQIISPRLTSKPAYHAMAIHFRNGLYANVLFDKLVGALHIQTPQEVEMNSINQIKQTLSKVEKYDNQPV